MAKQFTALGYIHAEADMYFGEDYAFNHQKLIEAHKYCREAAESALRSGFNVVVSNTFSRRWEVEPYLAMANKYGATVYIMEAKGNFESVHNVPREVILRMAERWERF